MKSRLLPKEIQLNIRKLAARKEDVLHLGSSINASDGVKMTIKIFDDGDECYLSRIHTNPNGYVLNRRRGGLSKNYLILHAATCEKICCYNDMAKPDGFTTRGYIKICSTNISELQQYVQTYCDRSDGSFTGECGLCKPTFTSASIRVSNTDIETVPTKHKSISTLAGLNKDISIIPPEKQNSTFCPFTEGRVEDYLKPWLEAHGYSVRKRVKVVNGIIDIVAYNSTNEWIIEAKGEDRGGYNTAEMNFRVGISQICSRMENRQEQSYGLAIPITEIFKKILRKHRHFDVFELMKIWLLTVDETGAVSAIHPNDVQQFVNEICSQN